MDYINEIESQDKEKEIYFLNKLITEVRNIVNDEKMINKCDICQGIIGRYLESLHIEYYPCSTNKVISNNITGHSFIVALIGNNYYLIDPAFIQFQYNNSEEVSIRGIKCISKSPYYYLNKIDSTLTSELINNGFVVLDEDSAFAYGNAFYFTKVSIPEDIKLTPISGDIFIKAFKKGNDTLKDYNIGDINIDFFGNKKNAK